MTNTQYRVIQAEESKVPPRKLLEITEGEKILITSLEAFGPNTFSGNVEQMQKQYSHPQTGKIITFREPTTAESTLAVSHGFRNRAKPQIFDARWLQAGRIVRGQDMVYLNPPKDAQGNPITNESQLKSFVDQAEKVNGIYLLPNGKVEGARDFALVPYETFCQGEQSAKDFAESGLARGLEHSKGKIAEKLGEIASKKNYSRGVYVWGFEPSKTPILRVASLLSGGYLDYGRLFVDGDYWSGSYDGFAFGVFDSGEATRKN